MELDDIPRKKPDRFELGADLTRFSIEELEKIVTDLEGEISRIGQAIERKKSDLSAADNIFKS